MKKAVVVGGSGFIGSHVADHLSDAGYQVTIYDKIQSQWLRNDQEIVIGDIQDSEKLNQTIVGAEVVYNFAALADLNQALEQPLKTVNINILGNLNVMERATLMGLNALSTPVPSMFIAERVDFTVAVNRPLRRM